MRAGGNLLSVCSVAIRRRKKEWSGVFDPIMMSTFFFIQFFLLCTSFTIAVYMPFIFSWHYKFSSLFYAYTIHVMHIHTFIPQTIAFSCYCFSPFSFLNNKNNKNNNNHDVSMCVEHLKVAILFFSYPLNRKSSI
jgi:hypothetical protein